MVASLLGALLAAASPEPSCPAISFDELRPEPGQEFTYSSWQGGGPLPGGVRFRVLPYGAGDVRVEEAFLLPDGQSMEMGEYRAVAGVILIPEGELNGSTDRRTRLRAIDPPLAERVLEEGEEVRIPAEISVRASWRQTLRREGEFVVSHAGCGELIGEDEERIQSRRLRVSWMAYARRPGSDWTVTELTQIFDIPVGANWFYSTHREENHPMQQGILMQGYTVP
jgi:hypothetical protein